VWAAFLEIIPEFDRKMAFRVYFMMLSMFYMWLSAPMRLTDLAGDTTVQDTTYELEYGVTFAARRIRALRKEYQQQLAAAERMQDLGETGA